MTGGAPHWTVFAAGISIEQRFCSKALNLSPVV